MRKFHNHGDSGWTFLLKKFEWPVRILILLNLNFYHRVTGGAVAPVIRKLHIVAFNRLWYFLKIQSIRLNDSRDWRISIRILPKINIGWSSNSGEQILIEMSWLWFGYQIRCSPPLLRWYSGFHWKGVHIDLKQIDMLPTLRVTLCKPRRYKSGFEIQVDWLFLQLNYRKYWWSKSAHPAHIKRFSKSTNSL